MVVVLFINYKIVLFNFLVINGCFKVILENDIVDLYCWNIVGNIFFYFFIYVYWFWVN